MTDAEQIRELKQRVAFLVAEAHGWQPRLEAAEALCAEHQRLRLAAEARVTELEAALEGLTRVAAQWLDTERGDIDGWIDLARAALAKEDTDE